MISGDNFLPLYDSQSTRNFDHIGTIKAATVPIPNNQGKAAALDVLIDKPKVFSHDDIIMFFNNKFEANRPWTF